MTSLCAPLRGGGAEWEATGTPTYCRTLGSYTDPYLLFYCRVAQLASEPSTRTKDYVYLSIKIPLTAA